MTEHSLDNILNSKAKTKIIRLFTSRLSGFKASGRDVAKFIKMSPPTAHVALKSLYDNGILKLEIIGKQHIYSFNDANRISRDILIPSFRKELSTVDDIKSFLKKKINKFKIKNELISVILYGSLQRGQAKAGSDVDIAVVVKDEENIDKIAGIFIEDIGVFFREYFGMHLDVYVKSSKEFSMRIKKRLSPVKSLLESYSVVFGKDPLTLV